MSVKITNNVKEILEAFGEQVNEGLKGITDKAKEYAKSDCPVDTGALQRSISNRVDNNNHSAVIGTDVEYAKYVEYNDTVSHQNGKAHFLRDAMATHSKEYEKIMNDALKNK